MIQRIYVDTSVIGGYFDHEFMEFSRPLLDKVKKGKIKILYSEITEDELVKAPEKVKQLIKELPQKNVEFLSLSDEVAKLAKTYVKEGVVGKTSYTDCLHIALATINKADVLASWNFKHIVNLNKIRGYNSVNLKLGYGILEIRSPKELVNYEE